MLLLAQWTLSNAHAIIVSSNTQCCSQTHANKQDHCHLLFGNGGPDSALIRCCWATVYASRDVGATVTTSRQGQLKHGQDIITIYLSCY